ncbi:hypothetical protein B0T21DRAFT_376496 [Apiosordaria backusii]|uniref:Uncharacterized protein n=1 Tax=Apiosordaria backusii TaxID=314023 RepID=A0AA40A6T0_9PEZI|nr:hypothetical protein B0T21DRAFT_376496 [Apiosordaria backusii]
MLTVDDEAYGVPLLMFAALCSLVSADNGWKNPFRAPSVRMLRLLPNAWISGGSSYKGNRPSETLWGVMTHDGLSPWGFTDETWSWLKAQDLT